MSSQYVNDVTEATFQNDVIQVSMKIPVLVDFWAEWCGPCKTLTPTLEALASEYRGAFQVAKVDTDKEQRLASAFRIQSLPTVVVFFQGQPVTSFQGALPKVELRRFLDQLLSQTGTTVPESGDVPEESNEAENHWQSKLQENDKDPEALLALGRIMLTTNRVDQAIELLGNIEEGTREFGAAQAIQNMFALQNRVKESGGVAAVNERLQANPTESEALFLSACHNASLGNVVAALETLIGLYSVGDEDLQAQVKETTTLVFEAAGRDDEAVEVLRRKLTRLLF